MIMASEQQAEQVAAYLGGGKVFWYEHRPTRITLFMVILPDGRRIMFDPRAAAPRIKNGE